MESKNNRVYYDRVNGLRGLSAIVVFLSHAVGMYNTGIMSRFLFFDGAGAVVLFFMISGFSNSIRYVSKPYTEFKLIRYFFSRLFRLYPPYLLSLVPIMIMRKFFFTYENMMGLSEWALSKWVEFPGLNQLLTFSILKTPFDSEINSTMWPMTIIIIITLLFPIILVLLQKISNKYILLVILIGSYIISFSSSILSFLPIFVIGAIIAKYSDAIRESSEHKSYNRSSNLIILLCSLLFINVRFLVPIFLNIESIPEHGIIVDGVTSIGCLVLILYSVLENKFTNLLNNKFLKFLGNISYSFYLLHFPVILTVVSIMTPILNNSYVVIPISFIATIIISYPFYHIVELNSKDISQKLIKFIEMHGRKLDYD